MKTKTTILVLLAAVLIFAAACGSANSATAQSQHKKTFTLEVTDDTGNVSSQTIITTEETVGAALVKEGVIEGTESEFGLMVMYVNGLRADYDEDGAWWAFYINGEMAMAGVDTTDIDEGETYAFVYTEA